MVAYRLVPLKKESENIGFHGPMYFLCNSYESSVQFGSEQFPTCEHLFHWLRVPVSNPLLKCRIKNASTVKDVHAIMNRVSDLNRFGSKAEEEVFHINIMRLSLQCKFNDPKLKSRLLDTGTQELVNYNFWNDTFWGVCNGVGKNHLGKLLMEIRESLKPKKSVVQIVSRQSKPVAPIRVKII